MAPDDAAPRGGNTIRVGPPWAALLIFALSSVALYFGWRAFWFLCDDAYIAFRYVSNSQLGYGYVWNAAPFLPVEGYTCFLWVLLLDLTWSITGIDPPAAANWLGLGFGVGSLVLTARMTWQLELGPQLAPHRSGLLAIVMLGMVTNASFLMWTSSGLETSLFNFLVLGWIFSALFLPAGSSAWLFWVSTSASMLALTRPDGMLMLIATLGLFVLAAQSRSAWPSRVQLRGMWPGALPLAIPVAHLLWRRSFYGEWLPNTYYAKQVAPWPESGVRYLTSFVLEYGLWLLALLALWLAVAALRSSRSDSMQDLLAAVVQVPVLVGATLVAHVTYYTLITGGDHFEYRVYSHLPALWLVGAVWILNRFVERRAFGRGTALALLLSIVLLAWPIPWSTWAKSRALRSRAKTFNLTIPMADAFPVGLRWYGAWYDELQRWLIVEHAVGKRHKEHQVFLFDQFRRYPGPRMTTDRWHDSYPVHAAFSVGVPGWVFARANIIDVLGLNDHVIARNPHLGSGPRRMAHARRPPKGYVECFRANMNVGPTEVHRRTIPLTAADIEKCESEYREQISELGRLP